jgi:hypothetical protein
MACSNDHLLLRYCEAGQPPLLRIVSWFQDSVAKQIVAMTFHPACDWLVCVSHDWTVFLLPVKTILLSHTEFDMHMPANFGRDGKWAPSLAGLFLRHQELAGRSLAPPSDMTELRPSVKDGTDAVITECLWWHTLAGEDILIITALGTEVLFVDLKTHRRVRHQTPVPVARCELVRDARGKSRVTSPFLYFNFGLTSIRNSCLIF